MLTFLKMDEPVAALAPDFGALGVALQQRIAKMIGQHVGGGHGGSLLDNPALHIVISYQNGNGGASL